MYYIDISIHFRSRSKLRSIYQMPNKPTQRNTSKQQPLSIDTNTGTGTGEIYQKGNRQLDR